MCIGSLVNIGCYEKEPRWMHIGSFDRLLDIFDISVLIYDDLVYSCILGLFGPSQDLK